MRRVARMCALLAFVACGDGGEASAPIAEVIDSAGIRIVTSVPSDAVYAEVAGEPALSIGTVDGPDEFLFSAVRSVARDAEGNLIVADAMSSEIRTFNSGGDHLRTIGGQGDGPGEFQSLSGAWPVGGGGIVALDERLRRVTEFDPSGRSTGTATLAAVDDLGMLTPSGLAGSRSILSSVAVFSLDVSDGEEVRPPVFFVRHDFDGTVVDTVAQLPGNASVTSMSGSGDAVTMQVMLVPFSPRPSGAGSAAGIAVSTGETYEVRFLDDAGSLSQIARLAETPTVRTDEHLEALVSGFGRGAPNPEAANRMMEMYRDLPLPATLPAYSELLFADTGELWAQRYREPGATVLRWDVFGAEGPYLGGVEVPASLRILEISRNQLLGVSRDDLGIERVEVRDLTFNGR